MTTPIPPAHFYATAQPQGITQSKPGQTLVMNLHFIQFLGEGAESAPHVTLQFRLMVVEHTRFYLAVNKTQLYRILSMDVSLGLSSAHEVRHACRAALFAHTNVRMQRLKEMVSASSREPYDAGRDAPYLALVHVNGYEHKTGVMIMPAKDFSIARGIAGTKSSGVGVVMLAVLSWAYDGSNLQPVLLRDGQTVIARSWLFLAALWFYHAERACRSLPEYVRQHIVEFLYPQAFEPVSGDHYMRPTKSHGGFLADIARYSAAGFDVMPIECYRNTMENNRLALRTSPLSLMMWKLLN